MNAPCKNCINRHERCHSDCEEYLKFLDTVNGIRSAVSNNSLINEDLHYRKARFFKK